MSAPTAPGPAGPPGPAYVVLLASSALGTLTSTIISAPINVIADALDAGPSGMLTLVIGIGSLVGAFTWAGQQGVPAVGVALVVSGVVGLTAHALIAHHNPDALVDPRLLVERRYLRSTAAAGTVMACLGVVVVATPLHLGRDHGMGPETIAAVTVALAVSMTVFAPVSSWIGARLTPRAVLQGGLVALGLGLLTLGWVGTAGQATAVAVTVVVLVVVGSAIGAVQTNAALGVMRSAAASHGAALGLHNMLRFSGLACGYAWVAISFPWGSVFVVYAGPVALVLFAFALLLGPPAAPVDERAGTGGPG